MTESETSGHQDSVVDPRAEPTRPATAMPGVRPEFLDVYDRYFDYAWCVLRRFGVDVMHVEDAVQDLFVVVHRRLPEFAGRSSVKTWLTSVAWRVASEYRRRRAPSESLEDLVDRLPATGPDPCCAAIHAEAAERLERLLTQLDADKRAVFVLAEIEEMSAPEIAEVLGINVNTVYSRLRAARAIFEAALSQQLGAPP